VFLLVLKDLALELMYDYGSKAIVVSHINYNVVRYDYHIMIIWMQRLL
jgi:hypothetical protein